MRAYVTANRADADAGAVGERLTQRGYDLVVLSREDHDAWPALDDADLVLALGSDWSVYWDHVADPVSTEVAALRKAHERGVPVLGICFGSQLLATALGGHVSRAPAPDVEIGWFDVMTRPGAPAVIGGRWFQWHYDRWTLPVGAELLASTPGANQAFRLGRTFATQFHPEVTAAIVGGWAGQANGEELKHAGIDLDALMVETVERAPEAGLRAHALVDWFLDEVAGS